MPKVNFANVIPDWVAAGNEMLNPEGTLARLEGEHHLRAGDFAAAERSFTVAVLRADRFRYSRAMRAQIRLQLAEAQRRQALLDAAEGTARDGLKIATEADRQSLRGQLLDCLAEIHLERANFLAAATATEEAIRAERALAKPDPYRLSRRQHRLGLAQYRMGRDSDAIPALESAIQTVETAYGSEHEETAKLLTELGQFYRMERRYDRAQKHLRRALTITEKLHGHDSTQTMRALHLLAGTHAESGDTPGAAALYERALMLQERVVGGNLEELADAQFTLAARYIEWGNYLRAQELLQEAIGTIKHRKDARLARAYEALAHAEELAGQYQNALADLTNAGKLWETIGAERIAELRGNLEHRAELLEILRHQDEAQWLRQKVAAISA